MVDSLVETERALSANNPTTQVAVANAEDGYCPVCFCPPDGDEPTVRLDSCGHSYCLPCFHSWIDQKKFPLCCLNIGCGVPLKISQLSSLLEDGFIPLIRSALDEYANAHSDKVKFCITADCPQVYLTDAERVVTCSCCNVSICTSCNIQEHDGLTCTAYQCSKTPFDSVRNHIIEEFLTLKCPRCKKAFFDFDGCFSVSCSNCPCKFCGWCLADCGNDAHTHVLTCPNKPPGADSYFGTKDQFKKVHQVRQKSMLQTYLLTLSGEAKTAALRSIETDLSDLGIAI